MSRMFLHLDILDSVQTEIFPIYELDFAGAVDAGATVDATTNRKCYTQWTIPGTYQQTNLWFCRFSMAGANLQRYLSPDTPRQQWQNGNIIKSQLIPYVENESAVYVPDPDKYNFQEITERPSDWGSNPNYFDYRDTSFTYDGTTYTYRQYWNVSTSASYTTGHTYYLDVNRSMLKKFYTEMGTYFCTYFGGDDYTTNYGPFLIVSGGDSNGTSTSARYGICSPAGSSISVYSSGTSGSRVLAEGYRISTINSAAGRYNALFAGSADYARSMCFVHFTAPTDEGDKDFYGIAIISHDSFSEDALPTEIRIWAFTYEFWGESIISGGGGGSFGPSSIPGGGSGTFEISRQDNRGDPDGHGVADRADAIRSALDPFFTGANGLKLHQLLSAAIPDIYELLYSDTSGAFLRRYEQSMYNPLSAIISVHMLPEKLVLMTGSNSDLTASGYNISNNLPTPQQFPKISSTASYPPKINGVYGPGLESFDFEKYFDAFPDFAPYTQIRLHLPYCGVIDIDTNLVMHGTLQVSYICDAISGNVAAYVYCKDKDGNSTYSYVATGNAAFSLPMFAAQQDGSSVGKLGMSLVGLGVSAATGNAAGITGGLAGAAGAVYDAATARRTTQITGQYSGNAGAITDTVCWLEITRPVWAEPNNYQLLHGETSQIGGTIADYADGLPYSGYLQVQQIDAEGLNATRSEIDEIEQLLKTGIYVNEQ